MDKYLLDGYDPTSSTVYEINGCFWHGKTMNFPGLLFLQVLACELFFIVGCLKSYARDIVNPVNGKSLHVLHQATVEVKYLENRGYIVVQVWECYIKRELEHDEDMKRYFDNYEIVDPLEPRNAFFGGRTNAAKLYHECEEGKK